MQHSTKLSFIYLIFNLNSKMGPVETFQKTCKDFLGDDNGITEDFIGDNIGFNEYF